jgi:ABC-type branched-subunit amino acid transport system substrate-binding protein
MGVEAFIRSLQATEIDYYDRLRVDPNLRQEAQGSNDSYVFRIVDEEGDQYRLADISSFLPFSDGIRARAGVEDTALGALLAVQHFNNPGKAILDIPQLQGCNVRLTTELFDTKFDPIGTTRLFTQVLRRDHSLDSPWPTAVLGAYRSAVTSPLAIISGVNEIPQVSYAATSSDFDVKEQYPFFGRTIPSTAGEAKVAVDYYAALGATHVAILYVTDSFGSSLQNAFQGAAAEANITTSSVAFSYSAKENTDEIPSAIDSIASTQFRYIFAISFEQHYDPIMMAAYKKGLTGGDYVWIFPGLDKEQFQSNARYPPGRSKRLA